MWRLIKRLGWSLILKTALAIFHSLSRTRERPSLQHRGWGRWGTSSVIRPHMGQTRWKVWMLQIVPSYQPGCAVSHPPLLPSRENTGGDCGFCILQLLLTTNCGMFRDLSFVSCWCKVPHFWLPLHIQWNQMWLELKDYLPEASCLVKVQ